MYERGSRFYLIGRAACLAALCALTSTAMPSTASAAESLDKVARADTLVALNTLQGCVDAAALLAEALRAQPDDDTVQLKRANALNCVMALRTENSLIRIDGPVDESTSKAVLRTMAPEALRLARAGLAKHPRDPWALGVYAGAYMFEAMSYSILEATAQGVVVEFPRVVQALLDVSPTWDHGIGHVYLAGYYLEAPWPVGDEDKASFHVDKLVAISPRSTRTQYFVGILRYRQRRFDEAADAFRRAVDGTCITATELSGCAGMRREAARALQIAQARAPQR